MVADRNDIALPRPTGGNSTWGLFAVVLVLAILTGALASCSEAKSAVPVISLAPPTTQPVAPVVTTIASVDPPDDEFDGVVVTPQDDLATLVETSAAGTAFVLTSGIHRSQPVIPKDGMTFAGQPGAVMSGGIVLEGFQPEGSYWRLDGIGMTGLVVGECIPEYDGCAYSQDLFMDDVMLWQVTAIEQMEQGRWFWADDTIYVADDPGARRVELSVTENAFVGAADDVTISDLELVKYATPAQRGTIQAQELDDGERGERWVIRNVEVSGSHGVAIRTGDFTTVSDVYVHHNGQMGIAVSGGVDVVVEDSEIAFNNIAGFDWGWEAGGLKATRTDGLVVRNNHSHENGGPGLWTDIDAVNTLYEGNLVVGNFAPGIFHEISGAAVIRGNTVEGNGFGKPEWLWGAGILVAASSNVEIYDNSVSDNADGIAGIQQERGEGPFGPRILQDVSIHNNTIRMVEGQTGVVEDIGSDEVFTDRNIVFAANTYIDLTGRRFAWDGRTLDRDAWLAAGQDRGARWE